MCGIAGIWDRKGEPVPPPAIDRFTDALAHRGPDGRGTWHDQSRTLALGHRRLAILDLSEAGAQPMSWADGRYWITFNGEIYNFLEIRAELEAHGLQLRTLSDTEVILAAYSFWGPDALLRFNGMWAFALFDARDRTLFLARDRFGVKPLLYIDEPDQFAFASELKAFCHLRGFDAVLDRTSLQATLERPFDIEGTSRTQIERVKRLPAGHYMVVDSSGCRIRRYWRTVDHLGDTPADISSQTAMFRDLFLDSVRLRARSDVAIGTCLSGGLDSSAVACTLAEVARTQSDARRAHEWQHAFVATFPGAFNDEREKAERIAAWAGIDTHFLPITSELATMDIDRVLYSLDDVYLSFVAAPWRLYRFVRQAGVRVTLDGHGADELLSGYPANDWLFFQDAPSILLNPFANASLLYRYVALQGASSQVQALDGIRGIVRHHPDLGILRRARAWWKPAPPPRRSIVDLEEAPAASDTLPAHWGTLTRRLYHLFHASILPTILRNFDRVSMAHGVEVRMPFMDYRLVTLAFSLPDASKIAQTRTKIVAAEAMRGLVPEDIRLSKMKVGFHSPLPEWLNGPLSEWARDLMSDAAQRHTDLFDVVGFRKGFEATTAARGWTWQNAEAAWLPLNALWFERRFLEMAKSE